MSNNNNRIGSRSAPYVRTDKNGMFTFPGPFIGIIKNNLDPTCSGRLQVYIPQLGAADEDDPGNWVTVGYASPYRGQTKRTIDVNQYIDRNIDSIADINSTTENSFQSYGMFFVPPDINIKVLCVFVNGDPSQGYWYGCVQEAFNNHMIPGMGSTVAASASSGGYLWDPSKYATHKDLQKYIELVDPNSGATEIPQRLPTAEPVYTEQDGLANINKVQMVPLIYQTKQLALQGLVFDQSRGTTSSSVLRETPSQVFGFSSPGRLSVFKDAKTSETLLALMQQYLNDKTAMSDTDQNTVVNALSSGYRTGGHQIVLDDGSIEGKDQSLRIRSASGNQILLDDTNGQIYIINAPGTAWIELSPSGKIDIFANSDFSVRTKGNLNFHSDQNIAFNAEQKMQFRSGSTMQFDAASDLSIRSSTNVTAYAAQTLQVGSGGTLVLSSSGNFGIQSDATLNVNGQKTNINCSAGSKVSDPGSLPLNKLVETGLVGSSQVWWQTSSIKSIVNRAPAHEPWPLHEVNSIVTVNVDESTAPSQPITRSSGTTSGVRKSSKSPIINEATLAKQPDPANGVCGLTKSQTKALLAQIGKSESNGVYTTVNTIGFSGKYQFGAGALEDNGYLKKGSSKTGSNKQVITNAANWTGKNGCNSQQDWLNNPSAQESAMLNLVNANCKLLRKIGVLNAASTPEQVGGYLYVSHLVGVGGAIKYWKFLNNQPGGQDSTDAYGATASGRYNAGVQAVSLGTSVANA